MDDQGTVGRLFDFLERRYGRGNVFMDIDSNLPVGMDFRPHLIARVKTADVLLAVITPRWLGQIRAKSRDSIDYVRIEIEEAIRQGVPVVPVLIGAEMPQKDDLPTSISSISTLNGVILNTGADFRAHMNQLCRKVESSIDTPIIHWSKQLFRAIGGGLSGIVILMMLITPSLFTFFAFAPNALEMLLASLHELSGSNSDISLEKLTPLFLFDGMILIMAILGVINNFSKKPKISLAMFIGIYISWAIFVSIPLGLLVPARSIFQNPKLEWTVWALILTLLSVFAMILGGFVGKKIERKEPLRKLILFSFGSFVVLLAAVFMMIAGNLTSRSNTPSTNDIQRLSEQTKELKNDTIALQNAYLKALEEDGLERLFDADRVAADQDFRESRSILMKVAKTVKKFRAKSVSIILDFPKRIDHHDIDPVIYESWQKGYSEGVEKSRQKLDEIWDLELEIVEHEKYLIHYLKKVRPYWEPDQGKFMFQRDHDLEEFNLIMGRINSCVERQKHLRESSLKSNN